MIAGFNKTYINANLNPPAMLGRLEENVLGVRK